ncbi:MAG: alpha/beta fold hydrolase [Actinomycetota bacterium]
MSASFEVSDHDVAERPVFFPAKEETLFGLLTSPRGAERSGIGAIVLSGGGSPISTNRNRLSVLLCRELATRGLHSFRFDYHGVGESTGRVESFRLDRPFTDDLLAAASWLQTEGITKPILIGTSCFGARTALATAQHLDGLQALVLGTVPVRDFEMGDRVTTRVAQEMSVRDYVRQGVRFRNVRRLVKPKWRRLFVRAAKAKLKVEFSKRVRSAPQKGAWLKPVSDSFTDPVVKLQQRKIPTLFVYGDQDDFLSEFQRARNGELTDVLSETERWWDLATVPGRLHGFTQLAAQVRFLQVVCEWVCATAGVTTDGESKSGL